MVGVGARARASDDLRAGIRVGVGVRPGAKGRVGARRRPHFAKL